MLHIKEKQNMRFLISCFSFFCSMTFANCLKASFCPVKHAKKDKIRRKRNYSAVIAEV